MNIGIVGIGLIGGSLAKDLKALGHHIYGYDYNPLHAEMAAELGLISEKIELAQLAEQCQIIIVSIPVSYTAEIVGKVLDMIPWTTTVIDTASTKSSICKSLLDHKKRARYVAAHPLAGTEFSGPRAAITGLYKDKKNIICEEHRCDEDALDQAIALFSSIGMQSIFMDPDQHDKHMAYVSHLSHVSAFMLSTTVLNIEDDQKQIFNLASTGFESTVRLAKSNPETWSTIFADNSKHLLKALDSYIVELQKMRNAIAQKDEEVLKNQIENSNEIKRILTGMKHNVVRLS